MTFDSGDSPTNVEDEPPAAMGGASGHNFERSWSDPETEGTIFGFRAGG